MMMKFVNEIFKEVICRLYNKSRLVFGSIRIFLDLYSITFVGVNKIKSIY
jgi:hypothetical protein